MRPTIPTAQAPSGTKFTAMVYSTQADPAMKLFGDDDRPDIVAGYDGTDYDFGGDTGSADPAANPGIKSPGFPQAGMKTYDDPGEREFAGTLYEATGTYTCTVASCTAQWTEGGIDLSTGWEFTPEKGAMTATADPKYQSYGWWLAEHANGKLDAGPVHFTTGGTEAGDFSPAAIPTSATRGQNACNALISRPRKPKVGTTRSRAGGGRTRGQTQMRGGGWSGRFSLSCWRRSWWSGSGWV